MSQKIDKIIEIMDRRMKHRVERKRRGKPKVAKILKEELAFRFGKKCNKCYRPIEGKYMTLDHIKPLFLGGKTEIDNLQLLCIPCHREKNEREKIELEKISEIKRYRIVFKIGDFIIGKLNK